MIIYLVGEVLSSQKKSFKNTPGYASTTSEHVADTGGPKCKPGPSVRK